MNIQNENDITKLKAEIERLEEWQKEYKEWSNSNRKIVDNLLKKNKELQHKLIVNTIKSSGIDLKNRGETIIKIITASIENEEMRKRVETAPKDKITLNIEKGGYQLKVSTISSQTIGIYMSIEEIEDILKKLEISKEETTFTASIEEIKENKKGEVNREEQIQRNCEQIQQLLDKYPNRTIGVLRTAEDMCQIREKGTKEVLYEGNAEETLRELKRLLEPDPKLEDNNFKRIQEIAQQFPTSKMKIERVNKIFCRVHTNWGSITFGLDVFNDRIDENIEKVRKLFIEEDRKLKNK